MVLIISILLLVIMLKIFSLRSKRRRVPSGGDALENITSYYLSFTFLSYILFSFLSSITASCLVAFLENMLYFYYSKLSTVIYANCQTKEGLEKVS
jgi:hypothetical protein